MSRLSFVGGYPFVKVLRARPRTRCAAGNKQAQTGTNRQDSITTEKGVIVSGRGAASNLLILKALIKTIISDRNTTETRPKHDIQIGINMPRSSSITLSESAAVGLFFMQRYRYLTIDQYTRVTQINRSTARDQLRHMQRLGLLGFFGNSGLIGHA